ncbi:MAG: glycosyltransferase 87 family protein [Hyphomicrobiaceae bacterium]|nr:glycosyltransferase 87 family protein [Hyphomicrobiaceae bacterium]
MSESLTRPPAEHHTLICWGVIGTALLGLTIWLAVASPLFGYAYAVKDMPVFWLAGALAGAGVIYLALPLIIRASSRLTSDSAKYLLWVMIAAGLAMRLVLFSSEPALEDDYQRYLWDGAVTANGINPYATSPEAAMAADPGTTALGKLAKESGLVLGRVNHPELRTLYPPVAQGAFAIAHWLSPWNLSGWRALILMADIVSIGLLLLLLRQLGRSPLWATLYWWNPVVLKEFYNSAHMDALLVPLVLGALFFSLRNRPLSATASLTLAAGIKIWPVVLLPLVWRKYLDQPRILFACILLAAAACALFAWPLVSAGFDQSSGLVAYAGKWTTNSALSPLIVDASDWLLTALNIEAIQPAFLARGMIALILGVVVLWQCRRPAIDAQDTADKWLIVAATMFLLSPAQFPWYYAWVLPFLPLRPVFGLLLLTATLPLYYTAFYFLSHDTYAVFKHGIVWLIWLPAWGVLIWEGRKTIAASVRPVNFVKNAEETS